MADLEDFFAKRDKSKKSKKKFDTAEDLAKVLDQKVKEKKKLETGKSNYLPEGGRQSPGPGLPVGDDDEWLEAEEKKPDFSNLKIQELILESDDDEEPTTEGQEDADGANEGPWNKKSQSKAKEEEKEKDGSVKEEEPEAEKEKDTNESTETKPEVEESEEVPAKEPEKESGEKKYVPPSLRNKKEEPPAAAPPPFIPAGSALSKGAYVPPSRRGASAAGPSSTLAPINKKKAGAPTLADEESFPSLS